MSKSVLPFRERDNFTQLSLVLQVFNIKRFKILFNGLNLGCILKIFLKRFANFSLDILIKYFLTKKECIYYSKRRTERFPHEVPLTKFAKYEKQ